MAAPLDTQTFGLKRRLCGVADCWSVAAALLFAGTRHSDVVGHRQFARELPVAFNTQLASPINRPTPGGQLLEALEDAGGVWNILVGQVVEYSPRRDLAGHARNLQQRFQFTGEQQAVASGRRFPAVHQGLLAQAIAGQQQALIALAPDCKSEHSPQSLDTTGTELLIQVDNDFGIGPGAERMSAGSELRLEFAVVVDLAIENNPHRTVFIRQGLVAPSKIDDRQPTEAKRAPGRTRAKRRWRFFGRQMMAPQPPLPVVEVMPRIVGSTMHQCPGHRLQGRWGERLNSRRPGAARYAAHGRLAASTRS